ncbi:MULTISPECIES: LacI family DNA-binding transcriptional regulator [unclassified Actinomyces]|uniref:LacI family DNA-binding transcriptional regulator n=1 Tax=unclassified Actinomyces TaxID=2609248 RepID=UPI0013741254|nr:MULTISPECIES: LacI family DNA-binding transcriptional regulator [unclassified Actinomyces]NDR54645.1 LacI family transcriptional regulator [Actinomyces sp. 565]QHO90751.1 LacI family transcriptional regulator [Actinomyces sp. 432]
MAQRSRKQVTLADVAREANCSVSLVSIVMRDAAGASQETRRRVKAVASRLGYRPDRRASSLRSGRSSQIGVTFDVHQPFHAEIIDGLYAAAEAGRYELVLSAVVGSVNDRRAAETLLRDRCEALVMVGPSLGAAQLRMLAAEVPVVAVARPLACPGVDVVRVDDRGGVAAAVDHLVQLGHRRIVHVDGASAPSSPERRAGYLAAMAAHGLSAEAEIIAGGLEQEHGIRAAAQMLASSDPPTAVSAFNDRVASGVIQGLLSAGVGVPDRVSVIGFDNARRFDSGLVPLTTIDQNPALMSQLALDRAAGRAAERYLPTEQVLIPRLIERASTGPVNRSAK